MIAPSSQLSQGFSMNPFDTTILVVLLFFAVKGLLRGLINEASSLVGLVLGGWLAYHYHPFISIPFKNLFHIPGHITAFLAFMFLLVLISFIAHIIGNVITAALHVVMLGGINRLGGMIIGITEGLLLLSMVFCIAMADYMPLKFKQKIQDSESAMLFANIGDNILMTWRGRTGK